MQDGYISVRTVCYVPMRLIFGRRLQDSLSGICTITTTCTPCLGGRGIDVKAGAFMEVRTILSGSGEFTVPENRGDGEFPICSQNKWDKDLYYRDLCGKSGKGNRKEN